MNEKYEQTWDLAYELAHHVLIGKEEIPTIKNLAEAESLANSIVTYIESDQWVKD